MRYRKIVYSALAVFLACVSCLTACVNSGNKQQSDDGFEYIPSNESDLIETGKYIVNDNQSNYQILIPSDADRHEELAATELQFGIEQCCGVKLPITTSYNEDGAYLSIGDTPLYSQYQEEVVGEGLKRLESKVVTINDDVIMTGSTSEYSLYAAYDFMEKSFGFKWYTYEDFYVKKDDNIKLYDFDFSNTAKMDFRMLFEYEYISVGDTFVKSRRMRCADYNSDFYTWGHTHGQILPESIYMEEHPDWYAKSDGNTPGQLCLSNQELLAEFIVRCKEIIQESIDSGKDCKYFFLGMRDGYNACTCSNCKALSEELYDRQDDPLERSAIEIWFSNQVARALNAWVDEKWPGKVVKFMVYAYYQNEKAPIKTLEDGSIVAVDERAVPDENIMMLYAPLESDFTYSFDDERCTTINKQLSEWFSITPNIAIYSYGVPYGAPTYPMNNLVTMEGSYNFALKNGCVGYVEEESTQSNFPSMQKLKNYIMSQKWWGVEKTTDELAYEFIDFYYKPVADDFKAYYAQLKQFMILQAEVLGLKVKITGSNYGAVEYWPKGMIDTFDTLLVDMIEDLGYLKEQNPDEYQKYFDRVNIERIWTNYSYLFSHSAYLSIQKNNEIVDFLLKYMSKYNVCTSFLTRVEAKKIS